MRITAFTGAADEVAAITAIYRYWVENGIASFELTAPDETEMAQRLQGLHEKGYPVLIGRAGAGDDQDIIGYTYASAYRPRPAYGATVEDTVYVAPGHHGGGSGRALLTALIAACESRPYKQMIAVIACEQASDAPDNMASVRLHAKLGFRSSGRLRGIGKKHGRWLDTVLMQREL
ncbi:MAG: N-acetyltransferase family protein [Pseudomonadota bacterium]